MNGYIVAGVLVVGSAYVYRQSAHELPDTVFSVAMVGAAAFAVAREVTPAEWAVVGGYVTVAIAAAALLARMEAGADERGA